MRLNRSWQRGLWRDQTAHAEVNPSLPVSGKLLSCSSKTLELISSLHLPPQRLRSPTAKILRLIWRNKAFEAPKCMNPRALVDDQYSNFYYCGAGEISEFPGMEHFELVPHVPAK